MKVCVRCEYCQKSFHKNELKKHKIAEHWGKTVNGEIVQEEKPIEYICEHCKKHFSKQSKLKFHINRIHLKLKLVFSTSFVSPVLLSNLLIEASCYDEH